VVHNRDSVELDHRLAILLALPFVFLVAYTMAANTGAPGRQLSAMALTASPSASLAPAQHRHRCLWRQDALALIFPMLLGYLLPLLS